MPNTQPKQQAQTPPERVKVTAFISLIAYDALTQLQRAHRQKTGTHLRLWQALDQAVRAYAKEQGIPSEE